MRLVNGLENSKKRMQKFNSYENIKIQLNNLIKERKQRRKTA